MFLKRKEKLVGIVIIFLLCAVLWSAIVYGMIAFVLWQAKPVEWSEDARMLFVIFGCFFGLFLAGLMASGYGSND